MKYMKDIANIMLSLFSSIVVVDSSTVFVKSICSDVLLFSWWLLLLLCELLTVFM